MGNLLTRIKNAITADMHELLDQKENNHPVRTLNQYLRQCDDEVEKVRKLIERQHTLKEEFEREHAEAVELASKRKKQAEVASQAGEDELCTFVLNEQREYEQRAERLQGSLTQSTQHLFELEQKYEEMQHKLKDMHLRRLELMGRENIVHAHHRVNQVTSSGKLTTRAQTGFEDMERYIDRLEHKLNRAYHRHTIDARIEQLERTMKNRETHSAS